MKGVSKIYSTGSRTKYFSIKVFLQKLLELEEHVCWEYRELDGKKIIIISKYNPTEDTENEKI